MSWPLVTRSNIKKIIRPKNSMEFWNGLNMLGPSFRFQRQCKLIWKNSMNWCLDANSAMKPNLLTHLMPLIFLYFPVSIRRRFSDVFMAYQKIPLALTHYSPVLLNYTPWRKHLLVKLSAISRQACNFTKNELLYTYFSKILAIFYIIIYCFRTPRTLIFQSTFQ